jgi:8-oxo-dGTP diphosphatase
VTSSEPARARVVIVADGRLALIRRRRAGQTYYLFPGGGVEPGETLEQAAVREAHEELGVDVRLGGIVHEERFRGSRFVFFKAEIVGGEFGTGAWPDHAELDTVERGGTHDAVWVPLSELRDVDIGHDVRPRGLVDRLAAETEGAE